MDVRAAAKATRQCLGPLSPQRNVEGTGLSHAAWMLEQIINENFKADKANRWLGYAQAILVFEGIATLDELRTINQNA